MNVLVQLFYGESRFLVRFQDGFDKDLTSNKLTIVTVEKISVDKQPKGPIVYVITYETVDSEKE